KAVNFVRPATRAGSTQPARAASAVRAYRELRAEYQPRARRLIERLRDQAAKIVCARSRFAHPYLRRRVDESEIMKNAFGPHTIKHRDGACSRDPDSVRIVTRKI